MFPSKICYLLLINVFIISAANAAVSNNAVYNNSRVISHSFCENPDFVKAAEQRIFEYQGNDMSKSKMFKMLDQVLAHPTCREIFYHQGLNGKNTAYLIKGDDSQTDSLMRWLIDKAPSVLATRERFFIFKKEIENRLLIPGMSIASIPCGLMDDLLTLEFKDLKNISITGIDLDVYSLNLAKASAEQKRITCNFYKKNAWDLSQFEGAFDLVTSNGLNIYEPDDQKVVDLYKGFFKSLRNGGTLVTSFLTPPSSQNEGDDAIKQRILFGVILGVKWQNFRTEKTTREQLMEAGFQNIEVIYDSFQRFPTVVATKTIDFNTIPCKF